MTRYSSAYIVNEYDCRVAQVTSVMASWNCADHCNTSSGVVSASEHGCVPPSMCAGLPRHRCVAPAAGGAWTADDPASPRPVVGPCPQVVAAAASFCPQRHVKVHAAPYLDTSDAVYCRPSRFPTSATVHMSPSRTFATNQEPYYNPGRCC